jgi:hypothetical protein
MQQQRLASGVQQQRLESESVWTNAPFITQTSIGHLASVGENEKDPPLEAITLRQGGPSGAYDEDVTDIFSFDLDIVKPKALPLDIWTAPTTLRPWCWSRLRGGMERSYIEDRTV